MSALKVVHRRRRILSVDVEDVTYENNDMVQAPKPKRQRKKTDRYGKRISTVNKDAFFDVIENTNSVDIISIPIDNNKTAQPISNTSLADVDDIHGNDNEPHPSLINYHDNHEIIFGKSDENFHQMVIEKLNFIVASISTMQKSIVRFDVRMRTIENKIEESEAIRNFEGENVMARSTDTAQSLKDMGFPIKTREALDAFNVQLEDLGFRESIVRDYIFFDFLKYFLNNILCFCCILQLDSKYQKNLWCKW